MNIYKQQRGHFVIEGVERSFDLFSESKVSYRLKVSSIGNPKVEIKTFSSLEALIDFIEKRSGERLMKDDSDILIECPTNSRRAA